MSHSSNPPDSSSADSNEALDHLLEHLSHHLPAQAPLARFVHHNTLHAFEDEPFLDAVKRAGALLHAEPFLEEERFEEAVASGRIARVDLDAALRERLPEDESPAAGLPTRRTLRRRRLEHALPRATGEAVEWLFAETELGRTLRPEVSGAARERLLAEAKTMGGETALLDALWRRCVGLATHAIEAPEPGVRLRDRLLDATGNDPDALANEWLIAFVAAYVDQGVAYWPMPARNGLWATFVRDRGLATPAWAKNLPRELRAGRDAYAQVRHELGLAGVDPSQTEAYLHETLQALAGWAGMVWQLETRPDLAPSEVPPIALVDFVALRLLLDRLAALHVARRQGLPAKDLATLSDALDARRPKRPDSRGLALELFVAAQRSGLGPKELSRSSVAGAFADEVARFDAFERRATYQLAYEHAFRVRLLDSMVARAAAREAEPEAPLAQMVFCIDEREESYRRQLEEIEPRIVTFGYAGNYDVLMSYEGHGAPHPVPLCPPVVTPKHRVREVARDGAPAKKGGGLAHARHVASRTLVRGGFAALTGVTSTIPLVMRTLFPGTAERMAQLPSRMFAAECQTELALTRADDAPAGEDGLFDGYTLAEQKGIVRNVLGSIGLVKDFAPLVIITGHGSTSVNNPHAAAYNCGACAGGRGGPNARAFAQMANTPDVRRLLAAEGLEIPESTAFVGAYHDTATDEVLYYDVDRLSEPHRAALEALKPPLDRASELDALERCRRFPDAPLDMSPERALRHAVARTVDLAQPRPEYCHATNAIAVVGRRSLTRGLFLDRRAFLISYDPTLDDADATTLEKILASVGPVGAGINLEYYFSRVDQDRYGCGTKLPHNITGLVGVMNGHGSDLRTGLHWQTVEIHEPMRLSIVVESTPEKLLAIAGRHATIRRLVVNRWVLLSAIHPETGEAFHFDPDGFHRHEPTSTPPVVADSPSLYRGRRDHLPFALVGTSAQPEAAE
ncbi:MAG: putative inorganic carbon transporter subunit DabA [Polyangiales bacterium]